VKVRSIPAAIALLMLALTISSVLAVFEGNSSTQTAQGEVRCEGAGAVVVNIDGVDYAANGMASRLYPPVQWVWNAAAYPESDLDRIIIAGLTLCDWESASPPALNAAARN
jgi:hypothetical protein